MIEQELPSSMESLLEYMGMNDPDTRRRAQLIATFMNQQEDAKKALRLRREHARRRIRQLQREHQILAERNDALAAALGACPICWGEVGSCKACGGQGRPGSVPPDEEIFSELVMPVLKLLGLVQDEVPPTQYTQQKKGE